MHTPRVQGPRKPEYSLSSLVDLLCYRAGAQADELAYALVVDGTRVTGSLSYAELHANACSLAVRLRREFSPGDRALLLYPSSLEYVIAFFGCLYAGLVPVPAYPPKRNRPDPRLDGIGTDARAALCLCDAATAQILTACRDRLPVLDETPWMITSIDDPLTEDDWTPPEVGRDSLAFLQYTSGSTTDPRGVMVSHGNLLQVMEEGDLSWHLAPGDRMVSWLPIFHDLGLIYGILQPLFSGIPCYFMSALAFLQKPVRWLQAISTFRGSHSPAPNFAYDLCVDKVDPSQRVDLDLSCWDVATIGAEPIRAGTLQRFAEVYADHGFRFSSLCPGYGLAESTLKAFSACRHEEGLFTDVFTRDLRHHRAIRPDGQTLAQDNGDGPVHTVVSSGHALGTTRVLIVDPDTQTVLRDGCTGEIWIAGPIVAQGYWERPEQTRETYHARLRDTGEGPFLRSGDLGFALDGEFYVTGRLKDLIIVRGTNHYPQDIELTVQEAHPALRPEFGAAFSVEVDDEERLVVVQELERTSLRGTDQSLVLDTIRRALFEIHELSPHAIVLVRTASILKTTSGKIQRSACRDLFLRDGFPVVASWQQKEEAPVTGTASKAPSTRRSDAPSVMKEVTTHQVEAWATGWIADRMNLDPARIRSRQTFDAFGMDSMAAIDFTHELSQWLGWEVDETAVWNYPSISALAEFVADAPQDNHGSRPADNTESNDSHSDELDGLNEGDLVRLLYREVRRDGPGA